MISSINKQNSVVIQSDRVDVLQFAEGEVKDTLSVKFKLCHANANRNHDAFTAQELQNAYHTVLDKPICYGHRPRTRVIGTMTRVVYVDTENKKAYAEGSEYEDISQFGYIDGEVPYIYVEAVVWKFRFPDEAQSIVDDWSNGHLYFSMETFFEQCKCSTCGQIFESESEYCDHLAHRYENGTDRVLINCTFTGAAKVDFPADTGAIGLAAADTFNLMDLLGDKFTPKLAQDLLRLKIGA